jgi:hypothetical protein
MASVLVPALEGHAPPEWLRRQKCALPDAVAQSCLKRRADMQGPEDMDRGDCSKCQLWRNVVGDAGQAQDLDVMCLARGLNGFQVFAAVTSNTGFR